MTLKGVASLEQAVTIYFDGAAMKTTDTIDLELIDPFLPLSSVASLEVIVLTCPRPVC